MSPLVNRSALQRPCVRKPRLRLAPEQLRAPPAGGRTGVRSRHLATRLRGARSPPSPRRNGGLPAAAAASVAAAETWWGFRNCQCHLYR